jgi:hypothetical protein
MKWVKRLAMFVVGLSLVLGIAAAGAYYYGVRGTPEWWQRPKASAEEQAAAANRADQKIMETLSLVREMGAAERARTQPADPADRRPVASASATEREVTFTEDELNGFFGKWDRLYGWTERYKHHLTDPGIVLHEGRIVVAGNSSELGTVISVHFTPELDDEGRLNLELSKVLAGRLPIPQGFFEKYRTAAQNRLKLALPDLQRKAEFRPDGSANTDAVNAAMAKLFLQVLANDPGDAVLFLPSGQRNRSMPVRLTGVKIEDKTLSLTVTSLTAGERAALLARIREPHEGETALTAKTTPGTPSKRGS